MSYVSVPSQPEDVELSPVTSLPSAAENEPDSKPVSTGEGNNSANGGETSSTMATVHPSATGSRSNGETFVPMSTSHGHSENDDDPDGVNLTPEALEPLLSTNQYTVRKMAAQGLMDVALMMANISQLRTLITAGSDLEYFYTLVVLVSFSLAAQVLFAIIIFIIWMRETEDNYREEFMATIREVAAGKDASAPAARATLKLDRKRQEEKLKRHQITNRLNYGTIVLVFMITVTNMFITGFGIKLETDGTASSFSSTG